MSISHVISWYDLGNPMAWAIYLSVAVEVFALASVSAASLKMKKGSIWLLFGIVTFIQIVGNVFFTYKDIDPSGEGFIAWMELIQPWFEDWDVTDHKRLLAYVQGGTLPFMSLIALHFYIKFNENLSEEKNTETEDYFEARNRRMEQIVAERNYDEDPVNDPDEEIEWPEPNENLKAAAKKYQETVELTQEDRDRINEEIEQLPKEEMIPDSEVKEVLKEEQKKEEETQEKPKTDEIVQKVTPKTEPNKGQVMGHRKPKENPGQNPQIMPGTN